MACFAATGARRLSSVTKPAICNWVWYARLRKMRRLLLVGEFEERILISVNRQFAVVDSIALADFDSAAERFTREAFDAIMFDVDSWEAVVSAVAEKRNAALAEVKSLLGPDGCAFFPVENLKRRRPGRLIAPLAAAGFSAIAPVYIPNSLDQPTVFVPLSRRAMIAYEMWQPSRFRRFLRAGLAAIGLHHLIYSSLFVLAYR